MTFASCKPFFHPLEFLTDLSQAKDQLGSYILDIKHLTNPQKVAGIS